MRWPPMKSWQAQLRCGRRGHCAHPLHASYVIHVVGRLGSCWAMRAGTRNSGPGAYLLTNRNAAGNLFTSSYLLGLVLDVFWPCLGSPGCGGRKIGYRTAGGPGFLGGNHFPPPELVQCDRFGPRDRFHRIPHAISRFLASWTSKTDGQVPTSAHV